VIDIDLCKKILSTTTSKNLNDEQIIQLRDLISEFADIAIAICYDTPDKPRKKSSPDVQGKYG